MTDSTSKSAPRIGFVSTRVCGTDGVSLEIGKWADVLERMGYDCYYIGGKCDRIPERSFVIPEADFQHPEIAEVQAECFGRTRRTRAVSNRLHELSERIKGQLYEALRLHEIDLIVAQNSLTIPMNIPLGAALVEVLVETGLPCIAHHHDFAWERQRFLVNAVDDYLRAAFPPPLPEIEHVVINSMAGEEFSRRTGQSCHVIPNVMDFAHPPPEPDEYAADLRQALGLRPDDRLILQPTRVVARKGIEHTIELVRRLDDPRVRLVISHDGRDEGSGYRDRLLRFAELMGVEIIFADRLVGATREERTGGEKQYSVWDIYPQADLVAYPSTYEGFGNAFLEAIYYRKPIFCNRYTIYQTEIEPLGFHAISMDGFLTDDVVEEVRHVLFDGGRRDELGEKNYRLARQHFSYERLERELRGLVARALGDGSPLGA